MMPTENFTKNATSNWIRWVRLAAIGLTMICVIALMRLLPMGQMITLLDAEIQKMGLWGPVFFALVYVVATVIMLPGAAMTLAAGGSLGLLWGTIAVSVGSTAGAALTFLISRYLARQVIEHKLKKFQQFQVIDAAVREGGWKIVVMLRLSPVIPFNIQNYLYGLTGIGFWPCVLASWLAMLPGTLMYVYLGYASRVSLLPSSEIQTARTSSQWALLALGLVATVSVTGYMSKLARRAIRKQVLEAPQLTPTADLPMPQEISMPTQSLNPVMTVIYILIGMGSLVVTGCAYMNQTAIKGLFGPPVVVMAESYQNSKNGPTFNHHAFDQLLKQYVNDKGGVDYSGLKTQQKKLQDYIARLENAPFKMMGRDEKLVFLINSYNAFTLELILEYLDHGQLQSIKDIPSAKRWDDVRWNVGGRILSLSQIEHEQIRPHFIEPRIHFALVCAAVGCPPLRNEAYSTALLQKQLTQQAEYVHTHDRWYRFADDSKTIDLTQLYKWYGSDFKQAAGSVLDFAARLDPKLKREMASGNKPDIQWLDYDWTLNSQENIN